MTRIKKRKMSGMMQSGGGFWFTGFLIYALLVILLVLGIAALWKYLNKK